MILTDKEHMAPISELQHLLVKLASEAAELSHAALKALEFGLESPYPDTGITVQEKIRQEFNDVLGVAVMLSRLGFDVTSDTGLTSQKIAKVDTMMDVAREYGVLEKRIIETDERMRLVLTEFDSRYNLRTKYDTDRLRFYNLCKIGVNRPRLIRTLDDIANILNQLGFGRDKVKLLACDKMLGFDRTWDICIFIDVPYTDEYADEPFYDVIQSISAVAGLDLTGIYFTNKSDFLDEVQATNTTANTIEREVK